MFVGLIIVPIIGVRDAESKWLEGAVLLLIYGMLAVSFFYF